MQRLGEKSADLFHQLGDEAEKIGGEFEKQFDSFTNQFTDFTGKQVANLCDAYQKMTKP